MAELNTTFTNNSITKTVLDPKCENNGGNHVEIHDDLLTTLYQLADQCMDTCQRVDNSNKTTGR